MAWWWPETPLYNDVHVFLAESSPQLRAEWIAALDRIESLHPAAVIAGNSGQTVQTTPGSSRRRASIRDFDRLAATTHTARELYEQMLAIYPDRVNPGALWISALALQPSAS